MLQDRHASLHSGIFEPWFGCALHDGQNAKVAKHPALQGKAILHVHPRGTGEESEVTIGSNKSCRRWPEVAVKIAPPRELQTRPRASANLSKADFILLPHSLLADVRRVAYQSIQSRKGYRVVLSQTIWQLTEGLVRFEVEEISASDARIVGFFVDLTSRQVKSG